ncbi:conserved hypothetical protein [Rubrivivax sp. A210]|uniref:hypothetical protein n=1 Tax=Rubrivivax sp. A210 TaxID=2772301 RepID=UPI0019186D65|nr:hypothetical protein [Rubrivivax sp. A210]CAD5373227.1 conserved hypothetical protein [Rubrivivax sp. A210]
MIPVPTDASRRRGLGFIAGAAAGLGLARMAWAQATPEAQADKLLDAVGGRAAWARVANLLSDSQQNSPDEPRIVRSLTALDFRAPRMRTETTAPGLHAVRVVDGERHWWYTRDGAVEPLPAAVLEHDRRAWAAHPLRTLQRLAVRDPALTLKAGAAGRLEVHEGGRRLAWYALDARGEPYGWGAYGDEAGTLCGPWEAERRGIHHPLWTASVDGRMRTLLKSVDVNIELGAGFFERPVRR